MKPRRSLLRRILRTLLVVVVVLVATLGTLRCAAVPEGLFFHPKRMETPLPARLAGGEVVRFTSADGTKLCGWFLPAIGRAEDKRPTVLFVHGNAGSLLTHIVFTDFLPRAGYHTFLFDYRGYGESEGTARRRDDLLADAHAALDHVLARDDVDPERVAIYGHSLGGALGLNLLADREEPVAGVFVAAFADWRDVAASVIGGDPPPWFARAVAWLLLSDHRRPQDAIARIERPVLLLHGTADAVVPFSHGRRLAETGPTADLVVLEGADHNFWRTTGPEADETILGFLRRHLGP